MPLTRSKKRYSVSNTIKEHSSSFWTGCCHSSGMTASLLAFQPLCLFSPSGIQVLQFPFLSRLSEVYDSTFNVSRGDVCVSQKGRDSLKRHVNILVKSYSKQMFLLSLTQGEKSWICQLQVLCCRSVVYSYLSNYNLYWNLKMSIQQARPKKSVYHL